MVRIPRTEAQVGFTPSTQPTWSGESAAAPGKALQQLGHALGSLGDAFQGEINKQDEFNANLKLLNWDNDETTRQIKSQADFNRDNPDGYAMQEHGARTERFNAVLSSMPNEKMKQKAQLHFASRGHNFYEGDQRFEFGKRNDMIYRNLDTAITGEFNDQALSSPEGLQDRLKAKLDGVEAMISQYPGTPAHKEALRKSAADMAFKTIQSTLTAADRLDDIDKVTKGLLQQYGLSNGAPQAVPGPQSQGPASFGKVKISQASGDHSFVESGSGAKLRVATAHAERFAGLVADLEAAGVQIKPGESGGYADRNIAGTNTKSRHAFGEAIDINWMDNARGKEGKIRDVIPADQIRAIAAKNGLKWGGDWKNPDDMHFEVDRNAPVPMAKRGLTSYAGMTGGELTPKLTAYAPQAGGDLQKMEGGYAASKPGPDGKAEVRTLEDFQSGKSKYITVAGDPSQYGKSYTIPEITWVDSKGQQHTSKNVTAVVHDTGSAFKGAGSSKFDIPVARDLSNAQMAAQPFLKGGVRFVGATDKPQQSAPKLSGGILTSLDDSPTPDEIKRSGAAVVDFDLSKPGAQVALKAAKDQGIKVAAYHEGAGGGASWGEGSRDLKSPAELSKLAADAKKLSDQGADYLHLDNLHDMKAGDLAKVAMTVKDATGGRMSVIAKNNPVAWLEVIKANPDLKPAYAVIEHGTKDKVQIEAARQLNDLGVPVHFVEFGDPGTDKATGQKRTDPISTPDEAKAFAKSNPWIGSVVHMKSQDNYNGREVAGGQSFRPENTIPGPNANKVADASGNVIPMPRAQTTHSQFSEVLQKHLPAIERQAELAREKWAKEQQGLIKEIIDLADKGYSADQLMAKLDESVGKKPELSKKYGLDMASDGVRQAVDTTMQIRQLRPQELEQGVKALDDQLKSGNATKELVAKKERYEKLLGEMRKGVNEDPISWANRTDVAKYQPIDWAKPETLAARVALARTVADYYGQPVQFFTKDERDALKDTLKMGGKPMLEKLGLLQTAFGPDMLSAMGEISKQAPEAATIGWMMTKGLNAQTIEDAAIGMERQAKRALGEKGMPEIKKADGRQALLDAAGLAFSRMPASEGAVVETVNAIMDARAQKRGLKEVSPADWKAALKEVIGESTDKAGNTYGGFQSFGGSHKVVLPQNLKNNEGFTSGNTFGQVLDTLRYEDIVDPMGKGPASGSGTPLSIGTIRKATPISVGDGRYLLALGDPNGSDPQLIQDGTGKNYVLDLNMLEDKIKSRRPDLYKGYVQPEPATGPEIERPPVTGN